MTLAPPDYIARLRQSRKETATRTSIYSGWSGPFGFGGGTRHPLSPGSSSPAPDPMRSARPPSGRATTTRSSRRSFRPGYVARSGGRDYSGEARDGLDQLRGGLDVLEVLADLLQVIPR